MMRELLASIKLVKFLGLEIFFYRQILRVWRQEVRCLRVNWILSSLSVSLVFTVPLLASVITFLPHILLGNSLTAVQAFVFVGLWAGARQFVHVIPQSMKGLNDVFVAAYRLVRVFYLPELTQLPQTNSDELIIEIKDLTASYPRVPKGLRRPRQRAKNTKKPAAVKREASMASAKSQPAEKDEDQQSSNHLLNAADNSDTERKSPSEILKYERPNPLKDLDLQIRKGEFVGVCGRVGSGKSTLLSAILGRMTILKGQIMVGNGKAVRTAVIMQDAWLFSGSIRENIIFGKKFNEDRYNQVLENCGLSIDLAAMEHGDETALQEYGANLSGGQRQRIGLARALYADAELLLLDDPLSAIDTSLGSEIFENALMPLKQSGTTVVFVSHRLDFMMHCDKIVVMKEGSVTEIGTHSELMEKVGGEYLSLAQTFFRQRKQATTILHNVTDEELEEEEEAPLELNRLTQMWTKVSGGIMYEEHPLDVSLSGNRSQPVDYGANSDSLTATVAAKFIMNGKAKKRNQDESETTKTVSPDREKVTLLIDGEKPSNSDTEEDSANSFGKTKKKPFVAESLFRSRADVRQSTMDSNRRGMVGLSTYSSYVKAAGKPCILLTLVIFGYLITHGLVAFAKFWLAYWLKSGVGIDRPSTGMNRTNITMTTTPQPTETPSNWWILPFSSDSVEFYASVYISCAVGVLFAAIIKSCFVAMVNFLLKISSFFL